MANTFVKYLLTPLFIFPFLTNAQTEIEPFIGYNIDLGNRGSFKQANIGLQYPFLKKRAYQMVIGAQIGLPVNKRRGEDVAYTFDPSLTLNNNVPYKSRLYSYGFYLQHRFRIISWSEKNTISLFVNGGIIYHNLAVSHSSYDKEKYSILNPHRDLKKFGLNVGAGIQYKRKFNKGVFFLQSNVFSPPAVKSNNYNYELPSPLAMHVGYIVEFKKGEK